MVRVSFLKRYLSVALASVLFACFSGAALADIVQVTVTNQAGVNQTNVPVTIGHVFVAGDVPSGATLGAKLADSTEIPLQVDSKTVHPDGSLRHAVLTAQLPSLANGATVPVTLFQKSTPLGGATISLQQLLATNFDSTVSLTIGGTVYTASARDLLQNSTSSDWLSGSLTSEWLVNGPVKTSGGTPHPHLTARFAIRAFDGLDRVRVSVTVENTNVLVANAQRFNYDASVSVQGKGTVFSQNSVPHYRQGRWRRVFWWGNDPQVHIAHDKPYFELTRAIPTYDPNVTVPNFRLNDWLALYNQNSDLMEFGLIDPYMPGGGAREHGDIAPLPGWTATWILSQDPRAKTYMLGTDTQAGTYNVHFRDENTGYPIQTTIHSNYQAAVSDDSGAYYPAGINSGFPSFATAEPSHEPDIGYVPYLITGDYFFLEEMQFWASWNIMYGSMRGGANGYVVWDQLRGQAWSLRSIAHAAYATPDAHPLKTYYLTILDNNRQLMEDRWLNTSSNQFKWPAIGVNPLGFITNEDWLGYSNLIASWMDDFMTWSVGHISALGFSNWDNFRDYKVRFPVGRTIDPASCWVLASTYWPDIMDNYAGGANTGNPVTTWQAWKESITYSAYNEGAFVNGYGNFTILNGSEQAFLSTGCASTAMYGYLSGIGQGEMLGYSLPDSYIANLQAALAVSVEAGYPNAQSAYDQVQLATNKPNYTADGRPAWALAPYTGSQSTPTVPSILLTANPTTVAMNGSTTLSWFVSNATSCTASGSWSGNQATNGSMQQTDLISDSTYTLTCTGAGGTANRSVTVTVSATPPPPGTPTITLSASPLTVAMNGATTLSWTTSNATSCTASGGWNGSQGTSGSMQQSGLTADSTYTLTCTGTGGSTNRSVTVAVDNSGGGGGGTPAASSGGGSMNIIALFSLLFMALLRRRYRYY